jgi:hypothetical protein
MSESQRYAKVPAAMSRAGWSRHSDHVAAAGALTGRGTSAASALADLGEALAAMASRASDAPAFGWDAPNRTLWVAVPSVHDGGSTHYIVHFDDNGNPSVSGSTTSDSSPAREAFKASASTERLRSPFYRD